MCLRMHVQYMGVYMHMRLFVQNIVHVVSAGVHILDV